LIMAALADFCGRESLSQGIVATNNDVRLLVRAKFQQTDLPDECGLLRGWRREHVLPELQAVLDGKRAVRVKEIRAPSPLEWLPVDQYQRPRRVRFDDIPPLDTAGHPADQRRRHEPDPHAPQHARPPARQPASAET